MSSARKRQKAGRMAAMIAHANQQQMLAKHHADCMNQIATKIARRHDTLRAALLECARMAEALKRPCGEDPESAQAVRNAQYQSISTTVHIALGTIMGPNVQGQGDGQA